MLTHMKEIKFRHLIYYMCCYSWSSVHSYPADYYISELMKCSQHINKAYT